MIKIKFHVNGKPRSENIVNFLDVAILDDENSKGIRFYFYKSSGERDWWVLYPYKKYAGGEQPDYIRIDGKLYTGDDLYRLARELMMKKEAEALDILEG